MKILSTAPFLLPRMWDTIIGPNSTDQDPSCRNQLLNNHARMCTTHKQKNTLLMRRFILTQETSHAMETRVPGDATQACVDLTLGTSAYQEFFKCKIDTGAEGTIMPNSIYQCFLHNTTPTSLCDLTLPKVKIVAYGGTTVKQHGSCLFGIRHGKQCTAAKFYVTETKGPILIGLPTCRVLGLVSLHFPIQITQNSSPAHLQDDVDLRSTILQQYSDVFDGIGCFQGMCHISVDPKVPPVIHPP